MKVYQWTKQKNVGDTLATPIVEYFLGTKVQVVDKTVSNKLIIIGSMIRLALPGDVVCGAGIMTRKHYTLSDVKVLSVRGRLTRKYIHGVEIPGIYGDPGLLMPLIYNPRIEKKHGIGIIPHWTDRKRQLGEYIIPVSLYWKDFISEMLSCERIVSSSLHGIVLAEAYGIPATWAIWGERTKRQYVKFIDYLTGTDRDIQKPGAFPPITNLQQIQDRIIKALVDYYA